MYSIRYDNREKNRYSESNGSRVQDWAHSQRSRRNRQVASDHNFLFMQNGVFWFFFLLPRKRMKKNVLWTWVHHVSRGCRIWSMDTKKCSLGVGALKKGLSYLHGPVRV
ncbi:hypothetical protein VNO78_34278 [Psophocarpus tetragonolobus]|uniref:Uncharacterized protein n=1 Tax=Psophocarpus tetragonolobus TaxID=3891 RepID=A0AAN9RKC6_PSOTE